MKNHLLVETPWKKLPNTPSTIYKARHVLINDGVGVQVNLVAYFLFLLSV